MAATATRRRAPARAPAACCPLPNVEAAGVRMDWREHKAGDPKPCRVCRRPSICRDCTGTPCHKTCAELEHQRDLHMAVTRSNTDPIGA